MFYLAGFKLKTNYNCPKAQLQLLQAFRRILSDPAFPSKIPIAEKRPLCAMALSKLLIRIIAALLRLIYYRSNKEVRDMFGNTIKLKMTHDEIRVLVFALNELRNSLIQEGRYTDAVDELLIKLIG